MGRAKKKAQDSSAVKPIYDQSFVYYNGAYNSHLYSGIGAWVKWVNGPNKIETIDAGQGYAHVKCPDRELLLVSNAYHTGETPRPFGDGWHEFRSFSWTNSCAPGVAPQQYMINYTAHRVGKSPSAPIRLRDTLVRDNRRILTDSGGYQFSKKRLNWIDPLDYALWCNDHVDEAVTLDLPNLFLENSDDFWRVARMQNRNAKLIQKNLAKHVRLFNVVHGQNLNDLDKFRDIVEDGVNADALCLAGAYGEDMMFAMYRVMHMIFDKKRPRYLQYHILGIARFEMLAALIRLSVLLRRNGRPEVTMSTDASNAVWASAARTMHLQMHHTCPPVKIEFSRKMAASLYASNANRLLPCQCPACVTMKYADVVGHMPSSIVTRLNANHNAYEYVRWCDMMLNYAETMNKVDYAELVAAQFGKSRQKEAAVALVGFVEDAFEQGLAKAAASRSNQMHAGLFKSGMLEDGSEPPEYNSLFSDDPDAEQVETPDADEDDSEESREELDKYGRSILKMYDDYHKGVKQPPPKYLKRSKAKKAAEKRTVKSVGSAAPSKKRTVKVVVKIDKNRDETTFGWKAKNRPPKVNLTANRRIAMSLMTPTVH